MNYQTHYNILIERGKDRILEKSYEKHHIIPKCMGGSNNKENIVNLTPEEHFVAHQLLVRIYPNHTKLIYAAHMMGNTRINNKSYGWIRRKFSELLIDKERSFIRNAKISISKKGILKTEETKARMRKSKTKEHAANIKKSMIGKTYTQERCNKMGKTKSLQRWFNNGIVSRMCIPGQEPKDFTQGRSIRRVNNVLA